MLKEINIAFVGSGAMGEAMISALLSEKLVTPQQIIASDPIETRRDQMQRQYQIRTTARNLDAIQDADVVVLSIKPQILPLVAPELNGNISSESLVVSIIAGTPIVKLRESLNHERIVRTMPNTPAQIGKGFTTWVATDAVSETQREYTEAIVGAFGEQLAVTEERYLDMATGLAGSGPGFIFLLIEALTDAGVQIGFSRPDAQRMVLQTIEGSVALVRTSGLHPAELKNRVTSPGGTTAAGLFAMERGGIRPTLIEAVEAAYRRSQELGSG